jgi:hypothetical protein
MRRIPVYTIRDIEVMHGYILGVLLLLSVLVNHGAPPYSINFDSCTTISLVHYITLYHGRQITIYSPTYQA